MGQPDMLGHLSHVQNISKPCRPLILSENGFPIWILMTLKKLASTIPEPIINQQVFSSSHCSVGGFPPNVELPSNHHPWWSLKFGKLKPWLGDSPCYITPGKFGGDFAAHSMTPSPTPSPIRWKASPNNELRWFFHNPAARWAAGEERFLAMERWGMDLWWGKMRLQLLIKHDTPWDFEEFQRFSILFFHSRSWTSVSFFSSTHGWQLGPDRRLLQHEIGGWSRHPCFPPHPREHRVENFVGKHTQLVGGLNPSEKY